MDAVKKGKVPEERLDDMARRYVGLNNLTDGRILTTWYAFGQDKGYPKTNWNRFNLADVIEVNGRKYVNEHVDNRGDNHRLARKVAAESTVYASRDRVRTRLIIQAPEERGSSTNSRHPENRGIRNGR